MSQPHPLRLDRRSTDGEQDLSLNGRRNFPDCAPETRGPSFVNSIGTGPCFPGGFDALQAALFEAP